MRVPASKRKRHTMCRFFALSLLEIVEHCGVFLDGGKAGVCKLRIDVGAEGAGGGVVVIEGAHVARSSGDAGGMIVVVWRECALSSGPRTLHPGSGARLAADPVEAGAAMVTSAIAEGKETDKVFWGEMQISRALDPPACIRSLRQCFGAGECRIVREKAALVCRRFAAHRVLHIHAEGTLRALPRIGKEVAGSKRALEVFAVYIHECMPESVRAVPMVEGGPCSFADRDTDLIKLARAECLA